MSLVTLVSGGLDSTVLALLVKEEGLTQYPLFIDYGQRARDREMRACQANFRRHELPAPKIASIGGFGSLLPSGLTDPGKHILDDAFLPGRNALFLTVAAAYAYDVGASAVAIGLLSESSSLFPDQSSAFLSEAETFLSRALGVTINVVAPLMSLTKADVVAIAKKKSIAKTYSCHAGGEVPCGECVACREYIGLEV